MALHAVLTAAELLPSSIELRWTQNSTDTNRTLVEVIGIPSSNLRELTKLEWNLAQWQSLLSAVVESGDLISDLELPPMTGSYEVTANALRFVPVFPLAPGIRYRAIFRPAALPARVAGGNDPLMAIHRVPSRAVSSTTVVKQIYPTASVLPENLLKFYLHFSAPMSRGHIYDYIKLRNDSGQRVELPFLEIDEELWNPEMTRLTLFLDPGRIKRGVLPLEEVGPALEAGKSYTLVIDRAWQDARGSPLREEFTKPFTVGAADRSPPNPAGWKLDPPAAHSREALQLQFNEPMDQALAARVLRVIDQNDLLVTGVVSVGEAERHWSFVPDRSWSAGTYRLVIPTTIEDLAGNNIGKPFEVDLVEPVERRVTNSVVMLQFAAY